VKNKKLSQAIVGIFVIGVWGTIFYKIYTKLTDDDAPVAVVQDAPLLAGSRPDQDTFHLLANYNDPFLNKMPGGASAGASFSGGSSSGGSYHAAVPVSNVPKKQVKVEAPVAPPTQLRFSGMVNNHATNKKVAMISINGQSHVMQENQQIENVKLPKIFSDSALVLVDKKKMVVRR
jgi:hypothetical protein